MAKTAHLNLRITPELKGRLDAHLAERGLKQAEFVEALIDHELDAHVVTNRGPGRPSVAQRIAKLESRMANVERLVRP